jgi:hypothetical protein
VAIATDSESTGHSSLEEFPVVLSPRNVEIRYLVDLLNRGKVCGLWSLNQTRLLKSKVRKKFIYYWHPDITTGSDEVMAFASRQQAGELSAGVLKGLRCPNSSGFG